jgi:hypothetical protein
VGHRGGGGRLRPPATWSACWPCSRRGAPAGGCGRGGRGAAEVARDRVELAAALPPATPLAELAPTASDLTRITPLLGTLAGRGRRTCSTPTSRRSGPRCRDARRSVRAPGSASPTTTSARCGCRSARVGGRAVAERRRRARRGHRALPDYGAFREAPRATACGRAVGADAHARR